jgi:hypothetical protein
MSKRCSQEKKGPPSSIGRLFSPFGSGLQKLQRFSIPSQTTRLSLIHFNFTFHVVVFIDITMSVRRHSVAIPTALACVILLLTSTAFCLLPTSTSGQQVDESIHYSFFTVAPTTFPRPPTTCFATKTDVGMQAHSSSAALDLISCKLSA